MLPFPSRGARDERKEKAPSESESVEVLFFIFCGTKKINFCFLYRMWIKYFWTSKMMKVFTEDLKRHMDMLSQW